MPPLPEVVKMADMLEAEGRKRVLDIGCGMGRHTLYLAARGFEVTATDNAPSALSVCKKQLAEAGLQAELVECDMAELPFPEKHFDGVVASQVIHHADRAALQRIIREISQRLAPGGVFVWKTPTTRHCNCGHGREVEPGTWVNPEQEDGIPHHYCTEEEARELLNPFDIKSMCESEYEKDGRIRCHWRIIARNKNTV